MVKPALPLVVLGVLLTAGMFLYIGGCATGHNWYPLLTFIPAALAGGCAVLALRTLSDGSAMISSDTWIFLAAACGASSLGLPLVFRHCNVIDNLSLVLHLGGDACAAIGVAISAILYGRDESFAKM
jgi:hypothetical protein